MECERAELEAFSLRYLHRCNEHRLTELDEFVDENVEVNGGAIQGLRAYAEGLGVVVAAFPDCHWDLRHLLVDGSWLSAHLVDTGTTPAGHLSRAPSVVETIQELKCHPSKGAKVLCLRPTW